MNELTELRIARNKKQREYDEVHKQGIAAKLPTKEEVQFCHEDTVKVMTLTFEKLNLTLQVKALELELIDQEITKLNNN